MQKITPFLWFDNNAEEAIKFYLSIFKKDSKIIRIFRQAKKVTSAKFRLNGQEFMALNGGPHFKFTPAISLFVNCKTQAEVDRLWKKLSKGGHKSQCGWLQDKFGLSWQIIPETLGDLLCDKDSRKAERVFQAMMKMTKIEIKELKRAYNQK